MIMLIINILFLCFPIYLIYDFVKSTIRHNRHMKKIKEFNVFSNFIIETVNSVSDPIIQSEMSTFIIENLKLDIKNANDIRDLDNHVYKIKSEIFKRWGKHIPGYIQSNREDRLKELGI